MRIYHDFKEAVEEVKRDLREMGIKVHPQTMQNKDVADDPNYETLELQNYIYTITNPRLEDLEPTQPWADAEFEERFNSPDFVNPGEAWKLRPEVWTEFLNNEGKFDYTYHDRLAWQYFYILHEIYWHPDSRQLYMSMWEQTDIFKLGSDRVPCSLGYLFQLRNGKLNITYMMRSCDIMTHYQNDLYLCLKLLQKMVDEYNSTYIENPIEVGTVTHYVGSFHAYMKDLKGVF